MKKYIFILLSLIVLKAHADTIPDYHKKAFNKVFNAEEYWHITAEIRQQRIDSLTKALESILSLHGLVLRNEAEIGKLIENYQALDDANKQKILGLQDEITSLTKKHKAERRKKIFWKIATGAATGAAIYIKIFG